MLKNNYLDNKDNKIEEQEHILDYENNELEESTETDSLAEIYNMIKTELEDIDSYTIVSQFIDNIGNAKKEIAHKFEGNKSLSKINEIVGKHLQTITNFFMGHFQKTSIKKKEVIDNLKSGINTIREHILNLNSAIDKMKEQNEILENKVTVLEEHKLTSNLQPIPQHNFHMNEAFVKSINSLSELIHMLMKNIRNGLNNAKSSSETIMDNVMYSRNSINEISNTLSNSSSLSLNSTLLNKNNQNSQSIQNSQNNLITGISGSITKKIQNNIQNSSNISSIKDKSQIKDKFSGLLEKIENINANRQSIHKNLKLIEQVNHEFYENAKEIFKVIKNLHNQSSHSTLDYHRNESKKNSLKQYEKPSPSTHDSKKSKKIIDSNLTISLGNNELLTSQERERDRDRVNTESKDKKPKNNNFMSSFNTLNTENNEIPKNDNNNWKTKFHDLQRELDTINKKYNTLLTEHKFKQQIERASNSISNTKELLKDKEKFGYISRSISPGGVKNNLNTSASNLHSNNKNSVLNNPPKRNTRNNNNNINNSNMLSHNHSIQSLNQSKTLDSNLHEDLKPVLYTKTNNYNIYNNKAKFSGIRSKSNQNKKTDGSVSDEKILSNDTNETLFKLTDDIADFLKQMNQLQKAISEKSNNRNDLKHSFENKKQELIRFTNLIEHSRKQFLQTSQNSVFSNSKQHQPHIDIPKPIGTIKKNLHSSNVNNNVNSKDYLTEGNITLSTKNSKTSLMANKHEDELNEKIEKLEEDKDRLREDHNIKLAWFKEEHKRLRDETENEKKATNEELNIIKGKNTKLEEELKIAFNKKNHIEKELKHNLLQITELQNENDAMKLTLSTQSESLKKNEVLIQKYRKESLHNKNSDDSHQLQKQLNDSRINLDNMTKLNEELTNSIESLKYENTKLHEKFNEVSKNLSVILKRHDDEKENNIKEINTLKNTNINLVNEKTELVKEVYNKDKLLKKDISEIDNLKKVIENLKLNNNSNSPQKNIGIVSSNNSNIIDKDILTEQQFNTNLSHHDSSLSINQLKDTIKKLEIKLDTFKQNLNKKEVKINDLKKINDTLEEKLKSTIIANSISCDNTNDNKEKENLTERLKQLQSENEKLKKQIVDLEKDKEKHILHSKIQVPIKLNDNIKKEIHENLNHSQDIENKNVELESKIKTLELDLNNNLKTISDLKLSIDNENFNHENSLGCIKNLKLHNESLEEQVKKLTEDISLKDNDILILKDNINSNQTIITSKDKIISEIEKDKFDLQALIHKLNNELNDNKKIIEKLNKSDRSTKKELKQLADHSDFSKYIIELFSILIKKLSIYAKKITTINKKDEILINLKLLNSEVDNLEKTREIRDSNSQLVPLITKLFENMAADFDDYTKNVDELINTNENFNSIINSYRDIITEKLNYIVNLLNSSKYNSNIENISSEIFEDYFSLTLDHLIKYIETINNDKELIINDKEKLLIEKEELVNNNLENNNKIEELLIYKQKLEDEQKEDKILLKNSISLDQFNDLKNNYNNTNNELTRIKNEYIIELAGKNKEVDTQAKEIDKLSINTKDYADEVKKLKHQCSKLDNEKNELHEQIEVLKNSIKIYQINSTQMLNKQKSDELEQITNNLNKTIQEQNEKISALQHQIDMNEIKANNLISENNKKDNEIEEKRKKIEELGTDRRNALNEMNQLEKQLKKYIERNNIIFNLLEQLSAMFSQKNIINLPLIKDNNILYENLKGIVPAIMEVLKNQENAKKINDDEIIPDKSNKLLGIIFKEVKFFLINKNKETLHLINLVWREAESQPELAELEEDEDYVLVDIEQNCGMLIELEEQNKNFSETLEKQIKLKDDEINELKDMIKNEVNKTKQIEEQMNNANNINNNTNNNYLVLEKSNLELENKLLENEKTILEKDGLLSKLNQELINNQKQRLVDNINNNNKEDKDINDTKNQENINKMVNTYEDMIKEKEQKILDLQVKFTVLTELKNEKESENNVFKQEILLIRQKLNYAESESKQCTEKLEISEVKNSEMSEELKNLKNKMAQLKSEFELNFDSNAGNLNLLNLQLIESKEESSNYFNLIDKIYKELKEFNLKIQILEDKKNFKVGKNYSYEVDDVSQNLNAVSSELVLEKLSKNIFKEMKSIFTEYENIHRKNTEITGEVALAENKLEFINNSADKTLKECLEENLKLKEIIDVSIGTLAKSFGIDYTKEDTNDINENDIVEILGLINQEITNNTEIFEEKLKYAYDQVEKYKQILYQLKDRIEEDKIKSDKRDKDSNTVNSETKEDKNRKYSIEQSHHFKIDASAIKVTSNSFCKQPSDKLNSPNNSKNSKEMFGNKSESLEGIHKLVPRIKDSLFKNDNDIDNENDEINIINDSGIQEIDKDLEKFLAQDNSKFDENLILVQLKEVKDELKITRKERDDLKKKMKEHSALQDNNLLKNAIEKLIVEVEWNKKVKEIVVMILRLLEVKDDHIKELINSKETKKSLKTSSSSFLGSLFK